MNKIIITGRLIHDPELKTTATGTEVCNFSVAVDRRYKKGEEKQCDFFNCTAWSKSAAFIRQYFHKGDGIVLEGRMESRKYQDKDGNNRMAWDLMVENIEFPIGKGQSAGSTDYTAGAEPVAPEEDLPF